MATGFLCLYIASYDENRHLSTGGHDNHVKLNLLRKNYIKVNVNKGREIEKKNFAQHELTQKVYYQKFVHRSCSASGSFLCIYIYLFVIYVKNRTFVVLYCVERSK